MGKHVLNPVTAANQNVDTGHSHIMADYKFMALRTKPSSQICYRFQPCASTTNKTLVVFLNGLGLPQVGWTGAISALGESRTTNNMPATLTYDRFGQGQTVDRDPQDAKAADLTHAHDCISAVTDLHQLITQVAEKHMSISELTDMTLVIVCNSIGGAIARLFAQTYRETVSGILFLDSVIANTDFVSIYPNPDDDGFDESSLPEDVNVEILRKERAAVMRVFHPNVGSKEGLSRRNLHSLLPNNDAPMLKGPDGRGPFITVLGHDFEAFAEEAAKMGRPEVLTRIYVNPAWHKYNEGLAKITDPERSKGPIQAPMTGHFIQKDNPAFVAAEINDILSKISGST